MKDGSLTPQAAFDQAVKEFNSGNLDQAKALFLSLRESGLTSPALELDLSKVYFKSGNTVKALEHAQSGIFLDRLDSSARLDLKLIQKSVPAGYGEAMDHPVEYSWKIYSYVRPNEAAAGAALIFFLFLVGALLRRSLWTRASIAAFSMAVVLGLSSLAGLPAKSLAVVLESGAELRSSPIESAEISVKVPPGARVRIRQTRGKFVEIERPSGFRGWVTKTSISRLL